jgi:OPA family glycerol-3-phosphate transporter-like MFS transporter 3
MVPMLIASIPVFLSFRFITTVVFPLFYVLVPILGILIGGVANLVVSLISTDLGRRPGISKDSLSTITGIIDGTGSFGAGIGSQIIGLLSQNFGWDSVFIFLILVAFAPCIILARKTFEEYKAAKNH